MSAETGGGGVSRVDRPRRWRLVERASADDVKRLARDLLVQPATAAVLANRGLADTAAAQTFLAPRFNQLPDPASMKNMEAALAVLVPAIKDRRRIVIHGDYDVDGVSGSVILTEFLRACGADVEPFIPDRKTHGYGFSRASLADCLALGAKVIVTCDCGTASVAEIDEAKAAGVDVVVTDHHEPGPVLPRAAALLNPRQAGETFPDKDLCGTGVAFFLIIALRRALREGGWFGASRPEPNLRALLDACDLPFDPSCLSFHKTERAVRTASSEQVRQPIYRDATEEWRRYDAFLAPLKDALGDVVAAYPGAPAS